MYERCIPGLPKAQGRIGTGQQSEDSKGHLSVSSRRNKKGSSGPGNSQRDEGTIRRVVPQSKGRLKGKLPGATQDSRRQQRAVEGKKTQESGGNQERGWGQGTFRGHSKRRDQGRVGWGLCRGNKGQQREQQGAGRDRSGQGKQEKARGRSAGVPASQAVGRPEGAGKIRTAPAKGRHTEKLSIWPLVRAQ